MALAQFLIPLKTYEFNEKAGALFGEIRASFEKRVGLLAHMI
jgi:hypothetical protein